MSAKAAPEKSPFAPSNTTDGIILAALALVCFAGMRLTTPSAPAPLPDTTPIETIDANTAPDTIDPAPDPAPTDPILPDEPTPEAPGDTAPPVPDIKPPVDIDVPSVKPEDTDQLIAITPRPLATLSAREQIASGPGFISLMGTAYDPTNWHRSTHAASADFLATDWKETNAAYDADGLSLKLARAPNRPGHFYGGEIQTKQTYGFGRYEVLMRPAKASGTVSSFFTYTGPYYGNPHDEVDIEFLGADTTKVYFNYFRDGRVGEDLTLDLPFDAADEFHLYAFEWHRDGITWFIDGQPVHQTQASDPRIPQTSGQIFVNLWSGAPRLYSWHGRPNFNETQAEYACISYQPLGGEGRSCSSIFPPEPAPAPATPPNLFVRSFGEIMDKFKFSQTAPTQVN